MKKYKLLCCCATLLAFLISNLGSHSSVAQASLDSQSETTAPWPLLLINERFYYGLDVWDFQRDEPYFDVQGFLDNQPGKLKEMSFSNQEGNETKASEVIQNISKAYGVNPKIILVLIELRTGSITGTLEALDELSPEAQKNEAKDFEKQIHWVMDALSEAYFLRLEYNLATITFKDGDSFQVPSDLNAGSFAIYSLFAQYTSKEGWHTEQVADDFLDIYVKWFDDPRIELSETELPSFWNVQPVSPTFEDAPQSCPNAPFARPTTGNLTSTYRDATGSYSPDDRHRGTDISNAEGTAVYAAYGGNLTYVGSYGIRIIHDELPGDWQNKVPARSTQTYYAHLSARRAQGRVEKGDWIGSQGWGGLPGPASTHLHVSIGIPWASEDPANPATMDNVYDPSAYFGACLNYDKGVRKTYQPILCCGSTAPSDPRNLTFESCNERIAWQTKHRQADSIGEIVVDGISGWSGRVTGYSEYNWNEGLWYLQGGLEGNQTYGISFDVKYLGQGDSSPAYVVLKSFAGCATKGPYDIDVGSGAPVRRSIQVTLDNCNDYYLIFGERYTGQYLVDNIVIEQGDDIAPSINFSAPDEDRWYNINQILSWTITDGGSGVRGYKAAWNQNPPGGSEILGSSGSINLSAAGQGQHTLYVQAWDNAGNASSVASVGWFGYDTYLPTQASNVRPNGWTGPYIGDTTPSFAWDAATDSGSGIAGYYIAVDDRTPDGGGGNDWWAGNMTTFNVPNALPEGQHRLAVTSKDNAGNVNPVDGGPDAPHYIFSVDINPPTKPQLTVSGSGCSGIPNNGWQNTCNAPAFSWTSSDSVSGVKDYRYYWGTSASGAPDIVTTATTFTPGEIVVSGGVATRTLNVTARDQLDHESGRASFTVRYDGAPPTVTLAINGGTETTNEVSVRLDLAVSDVGSGVYQMRFSNNGLEWTAWEPTSSAKAWTLPALDRRAHTVYAQVRDRAGNASGIANASITLDLYPVAPHSASFRICDDVVNVGGSVGLTSTSFSLVSAIGQPWASGAVANNSAIHSERSGFLASLNGCRPITHSTTTNYTVTQWVVASGGNLRGSASFRLGDTAGQPAASGTGAFTSSSFTLSSGFWAQITGTVPLTTPIPPTPPPPTLTPSPTPGPTPTPQPGSFGVSINGGALYTNDPTVTVNAWAPNVTQVRLSNDGGYADAGWTTYQLTHTWTISTYGSYVMPRIVYAWFKDAQSAVYGPYQDEIVYDPIAPQGRVQIVGQIARSARHTPLSAASVVTLSLEASDDNSGVASMRLGEDTLESAAWRPFTDTVTWTLQSDIVYAQFRDGAGNLSSLFGSDGSEHALASRPLSVTLSGPTMGLTNTAYAFTADVLPVTATLPITYVWQVSGHAPITHAAVLNTRDVLSFTWDVTGTQTLTVTALNSLGVATGTHTITLLGSTPACARPLTDVDIDGPLDYYTATLYIDTLYTFAAILTPHDATWPITYTWAPPPEFGQGSPYSSYQWSEPGTYTITLAVQNCGGIPATAQRMVTIRDVQEHIYLPLVLRNQ